MEKTVVQVPGLWNSTRHAFTQCVRAGDLVFVAGQVGVDREGRLVSGEFEPQVRQIFENMRLALEAAGSSLRHVVSMTVFITDMRRFDEFIAIRHEILGDDLAPSALIGIAQLANPAMLVEIQSVGVVASRG